MHPLVSELPQNVLPEVTAFGIRCEKLLILPLRNIEIAINLTAVKSQIQLLLAFVIYGPAKDARFYPYPLHRLLSLPFSPSYARLPKAHGLHKQSMIFRLSDTDRLTFLKLDGTAAGDSGEAER
jgi:hypothetical protein